MPATSPSEAALTRALFRNRLVGVEVVDAEGRWVEVNDRFAELLGRRPEEVVGRLVEDLTHPDDLAVERAENRRLRDGEVESCLFRKRLLGGDGRWTWVEAESSLAPGRPQPRRISLVRVLEERGPELEEAARWRALMAQSPLSVVVIDPQTGEFLDFNDAACESLGYTREEFSRLTLRDVYSEGTAVTIRSRIETVMATGTGRFESRHRTKSGEVRQVTVHSRRIRYEGGDAVQSVWQDVTSLWRAAQDKARHDSLVRQIIHSAPLPMGIVELREDHGDVLHVFDNPAACRSFGLPVGATSGRWDGAELGVRPETVKTWIAAYRASRRLRHAVHFEDSHDHAGARRWLGVVVTHVGMGPNGRDRFCYIAEDITDRKRAEEEILRLNRSLERQADELRTVFEVLPIGVGIADDSECRSIRANPTLSRLLRQPPGGNVSLTAPEAERPTSFKIVRDGRELGPDELPMQVSAKEGVVLNDVEVDVLFEDGRVIKLMESVAPLFDEGGAPRGCVGAFLNVTERRKAEAERERLLNDLRDADRRKDEFLAMLAHELRNPLSAVGNAAQILLVKKLDDAEARWCCDVIQRQTRRLSRLLDDLLDVSRITRGKIVLKREAVDLRGVVERAVETTRPIVESRRHRVEVRLPDAPLTVLADPARMEQVVVNLVGNAAKYSEEGRVITIRASRRGDEAVVAVEDEGVGMAPEVLARVFDMFAQAETSLDRAQGGLGIGLTIARSLVEMQGGFLTAESDGPGRGSRFIIRMPGVDRPEPAREPAPTSSSAGAEARRVLLVDDNVDAVLALSRLLEGGGHRVQVAFDGLSALDAVVPFRPEVVILDIGLPGMDGYEVAARLRGLPGGADLLLVALTGYGRESDRRRAFAAGFDHHLIKPVELDAILGVLRRGEVDA